MWSWVWSRFFYVSYYIYCLQTNNNQNESIKGRIWGFNLILRLVMIAFYDMFICAWLWCMYVCASCIIDHTFCKLISRNTNMPWNTSWIYHIENIVVLVIAISWKELVPHFGITNLDWLSRSCLKMGLFVTFQHNYWIGWHVLAY